MKNLRNILFLIVALILQISLKSILPASWEVIPNPVLIIVMLWCLLYDYQEALLWAFIGGFFLELYAPYGSQQFYCANIIAIILVVTSAYAAIHYLVKEINYIVIGIYVFFSTLLFNVLQFALKDNSQFIESGFLKLIFLYNLKIFIFEGILNIFLVILIVLFLKKVKGISIEKLG